MDDGFMADYRRAYVPGAFFAVVTVSYSAYPVMTRHDAT
jgi:hypothetical protein